MPSSTVLQITASRSCNGCRTMLLGSYYKSLDNPTPLLRKLHLLPVQQRIDYKVALLTFKVCSTSTPLYLRRLIKEREHVHNLRSATMSLSQPLSRTTFAKRAFHCTAPAIWNSLPKTVIDIDSITIFKSRLKTFLRLTLFPFLTLTSTLPGHSASEVKTIRRYTNSVLLLYYYYYY